MWEEAESSQGSEASAGSCEVSASLPSVMSAEGALDAVSQAALSSRFSASCPFRSAAR